MNDFRRPDDKRSPFDDATSKDYEQEDEIELVDEKKTEKARPAIYEKLGIH